MGQHTPLFETHRSAGAKIVDFGGWDMPLHYGSQVEEHHAVRQSAGVFDVSHMNVVEVSGHGSRDFLRRLLANDVDRLATPGKALYSCMLNEAGGVIDDLIVYGMGPDRYRLVLNAATRDKDLAWLREQAPPSGVEIDAMIGSAMLAVQGPRAREIALTALPETLRESLTELPVFTAIEQGDTFVARTGYTGEDGFEIILPAELAASLWKRILDAGAKPAGLGARDTLRLEAGMHLYGNDMDESTSPLDSGLGWTVAWQPRDRDFIGRAALEARKDDPARPRFRGLLLEDRGVLRDRQRVVLPGGGSGEITSGGFSPTLGRSIAMARLPAGDEERAKVEVRNRLLDVRVVPLPFVRNGKAKITI